MPSSRGTSWPRDWTPISSSSCIGRQILYHWATWEAPADVRRQANFKGQASLSFGKHLKSISTMCGEGSTAHSSTLAWRIPWTGEPGGLQSIGSLGVGHDWVTSLSLFTFMHWRRKRQPIPVFLPGESQGRGSLVGCAIYGVAQNRTRLTLLSSSSSSSTMWRIVEEEVLREPWGEQDFARVIDEVCLVRTAQIVFF